MSEIDTALANAAEKERLKNEVIERLKRMLGGDTTSAPAVTPEVESTLPIEAPASEHSADAEDTGELPVPPLEDAVNRAIFSLGEIAIFSDYGRYEEAAREAREALDAIQLLKTKYDEQNEIIAALSGKREGEVDESYRGMPEFTYIDEDEEE